MKTASIISIGNELLNGQTVDTNSNYLTGRLLSLGIVTVSVYIVGDDLDRIVEMLKLASRDCNVVIITGGLGPTDDDLTREALAAFLGSDLTLRRDLLVKIESYFSARNLKMSDNNKRQAYIPKDAEPLENGLGTAAGIVAYCNDKIYAALPGVPSEMKDMFACRLIPILKDISGKQAVVTRRLKCFGAGESNIASRLGSLLARDRNPLINITVSTGIITLTVTAGADDEDTAKKMTETAAGQIRSKLGDLIFGEDDETLASVAGRLLTLHSKTLATAESCTAGLLAGLITDVPGCSAYYRQGWITYSNESKTELLDVDAGIIEKHGAVSCEVASAMAVNARRIASVDYALAITGIAGPSGGTAQKPVGLVYISVASQEGCRTERYIFSHDRGFIRLRSAQTALDMLRHSLVLL